MKKEIENLTNLLGELNKTKEQETLNSILSSVCSLSISEDLPAAQNKLLTCAKTKLIMAIQTKKHYKLIYKDLKFLINVLEDIRVEDSFSRFLNIDRRSLPDMDDDMFYTPSSSKIS